MAKIIKVGSQNPTFTPAKTKKASSIQTHRNSNEVTNPFKFTNFEGNTLQFADVFEGFKPKSTSKLRMVASSVTGSMNKMKTGVSESIVNFVNRVRESVSNAWTYAKNTNVSDVPVFKKANEILNTPIVVPGLDILASRFTDMRENISSRMSFLNRDVMDVTKELSEKWNTMISNISIQGKQKYSNMTVAELETMFALALAEGGSNE